jgi:membrane peptidoglycan carboxypeptidase
MRNSAANLLQHHRENIIKYSLRAAIFLFGGIFVAASFIFTYAYFTVGIPDPKAFVNSQSTIIQYADGTELGRLGSENRTIVPLAKIPLNLRHAVLAAEDRNFYSEHAFSPQGLARAIWDNIKSLGNGGGGSTITQQYAKTAFLTPERSIQRKIKEIVIAIKLEQQQSKDQILENYLNTIWFGRGSYGVQTAAQTYFGRNVNQLTIPQEAVLASILRSPNYYGPSYTDGLNRLKARWQYVIDGMVKTGWLDVDKAKRLKFPLILPKVTSGALAGPKGYLISYITAELQKLGFTDSQLQVGGLVVKTTLEARAQSAAQDAVASRIPAKAPDNLRVALVSIRPGTGEIVAMYGGRDYLKNQLNNATQSTTQAGSSFKPFALVAALENGISLQSTWLGKSPAVYDDPNANTIYSVFNYSNEQFGKINLLDATAHSVNTVFVPLGMKAGLNNVVDVARRAGIPDSVQMWATPSVSLGVASPHVIDVASAYATFASGGVYAKPFMVKEVLGANQGVLYESRIQAQQVFSSEVMSDLTYALQGVVTYGTGTAAAVGLNRPIAGKTGTTTDNASAWFNGYTPQLATSVSLFRNDGTESLNGIGGLGAVTGGTYPAMIWNSYTKVALKDLPVVSFPTPANIGGTEPTDFSTAVPTLDPSLAVRPTPATKKPTPAPKRVNNAAEVRDQINTCSRCNSFYSLFCQIRSLLQN